jgi:hypothetical protein
MAPSRETARAGDINDASGGAAAQASGLSPILIVSEVSMPNHINETLARVSLAQTCASQLHFCFRLMLVDLEHTPNRHFRISF